ncbi:MAG: 50S ribosomal protein L18 [Planctomycetota bacterium]
MNREKLKAKLRLRKQLHVRRRIRGTLERPRLAVFRSQKHFYAQLVNDDEGRTLATASTLELKDKLPAGKGSTCAAARLVGEALGEKASGKGILKAVFDRRFYRYHGRVKALADGARAKGLQF